MNKLTKDKIKTINQLIKINNFMNNNGFFYYGNSKKQEDAPIRTKIIMLTEELSEEFRKEFANE